MATINEIQLVLQNLLNRTVTQVEISKALGTGRGNISARLKYKSILKVEEIKKIENYFDVDLSNFVAREKVKNDLKNYFKIQKLNENSDCANIVVRGEVSASMGYGVIVYDETQTGVYQVSKKLMNDLNINQNSAEIIFASGDSMQPTIEGGDSLLIDKSKTDIYDGRIYCVRIDGQLYAKRLQKIPPSTVVVVSDNNKYRSFEIDFSKDMSYDFAVIGEVKWWGRTAR